MHQTGDYPDGPRRDKGIINLPEDEKMTVELVDNWQNTYKPGGVYPLGVKDRECLDQIFDKLHEEGKMDWMRQPTPFASPCFVVWRNSEGRKKGCVVIDLRGLNKNVLPDSYPLLSSLSVDSAVKQTLNFVGNPLIIVSFDNNSSWLRNSSTK
ncbi:hypothetical protein F4818DRAFT_440751 [Hypoxylon cercidicola]|nr:hypothetical protein F4818DRAFT_440751 [Hypoxylon cercidicola]